MELGEVSFKCLTRGLHLENPQWTKGEAFEKVHLFQLDTGDFLWLAVD